jgi:HK97 family phage portal protein
MANRIKIPLLSFLGFRRTASPESPTTSLSNPASWLTALFAPLSKSGATVSKKSVISLSTVWRAVSIISQTVASLPFQVIREDEDGSVFVDKKHDLHYLLMHEPSPLYNSFNFMRALVAQACFYGNGYAVINVDEDTARPKSFTIIDQSLTPVESFIMREDGVDLLFYKIAGDNKTIPSAEMIHISGLGFNGLAGENILSVHRDNYGLAIAARDFGNTFFKNGTFLSGYLKTEKSVNLEGRKRIAGSWSSAYSGLDNAGKVPVLDEGFEFKPMGLKPEEASMLETVRFTTEDIARIFGVPPHLLYALERATFNNIEHLSQEFATYTILPWATQIEEEFSRKIFKEYEKRYTRTRNSRYFARLDMSQLLKADAEGRSKLYQSGIQNGWLSPNEARQKEGLNPVDGGNQNFIQLNMTTLKQVGENTAANEQME